VEGLFQIAAVASAREKIALRIVVIPSLVLRNRLLPKVLILLRKTPFSVGEKSRTFAEHRRIFQLCNPLQFSGVKACPTRLPVERFVCRTKKEHRFYPVLGQPLWKNL
jgi:hypothetical protein